MRDWYDQNALVQMHMREMRAAAQQEHLARRVRVRVRAKSTMRSRMGHMLIAAGEALTR